MAWQRKYRPKLVSELHLTEVRTALQNMMQQGKFPQVLLFAGPRGTGKTSASRIIGNLLNDPKNAPVVDFVFFGKKKPKTAVFQEPDTDSAFAQRVYSGNSFVVQEMDAASYRGIDDVRALKERVMIPPQEGKIAVYILDEVHMFTTEAFNALLKVLEEPPAHAVFILATTELHKIPETIVSRSTKLDFRKATLEELQDAVQSIAQKEKLTSEPEAVALIAQRADGSFRDAVKLLELVAQSGAVTLSAAEAVLGRNMQQSVADLIEYVLQKDAAQVSAHLAELRNQSVQETYFYKMLFSYLHQALMQDLGVYEGQPAISAKITRFLLQELLKGNLQQASPVPFLPLELKLLEIIERSQQQASGSVSAKKKILKTTEFQKTSAPTQPAEFSSVPSAPSRSVPEDSLDTVPSVSEATVDADLSKMGKQLVEQWERFLLMVQERNATLAALLRSSKPALGDNGIPQVGVYYKFHQEQLQQQKYMALIQDCTKDVVGVSLPLQIALQPTPVKASLVETENSAEDLTVLAEEALM